MIFFNLSLLKTYYQLGIKLSTWHVLFQLAFTRGLKINTTFKPILQVRKLSKAVWWLAYVHTAIDGTLLGLGPSYVGLECIFFCITL